jgi:phospholipase C
MSLRATRREVLKGGVAAGAGVAAASALPASIAQALAAAAAPACSALSAIEHVVILIQENRSFDQYFGRYRGVRGFDDRSVLMGVGDDGTKVFKQSYPTGAIGTFPNPALPFHIQTSPAAPQQGDCTNDVEHQWKGQHAMWNNGSLDQWISTHLNTNPGAGGKFAGITVGYYEGSPARDHSGDVDLHWALADNFTICDNYFCSVIGGTDINRLYSLSGTCDPDGWDGGCQFLDTKIGTIQNPGADLGTGGKWVPYPQLLQNAGISWKVYGTQDAHLGDNVLRYFPQFRPSGGNPTLAANAFGSSTFPTDFTADCAAGTLPQVSWVLTNLPDTEHAPAAIEWGQDIIHTVVLAMLQSPLWPKSALFVTYDENGGFFDHVPPLVPPAASNPLSAGEYLDTTKLSATATAEAGTYASNPIGLGFRVPTLVISPFSRNTAPTTGPLVCSDPFDHTSLLRFLERLFKVPLPDRDPVSKRPGLSPWRRQAVGDLTSAFNFAAGGLVSAPTLPITNRADPRVLAECPSPAGTLATTTFDMGYPLPATTPMPTQEPLPPGATVRRPSGPCAPADVPEGIPPLGLAATGVALAAAAWWARRIAANRSNSGPNSTS